jgi:hypothetical protein
MNATQTSTTSDPSEFGDHNQGCVQIQILKGFAWQLYLELIGNNEKKRKRTSIENKQEEIQAN